MKSHTIRIIAAAFVLLAVTLACLGTTPQEVMDDARTTATMQAAQTQAYILINGGTATQGPGPTNTLASGEIVQTNIAATYAVQTGLPTFTSTAALPAPTKSQLPNTAVPTNTPIRIDPTQPAGTGVCEDGKPVLVYNADAGQVLDRTPLGEAERADILEISYEGKGLGFGSHARAIIVIPRLGPVWMVDAVAGSDTIMTRGFCGTNEAVTDWAIKAHIPSLQAASRDSNGDQPPADEIAVYRLDFEAGAFIVEKAATAANAPTPEEVLSWIEVMFNENGHASAVPMHVVR